MFIADDCISAAFLYVFPSGAGFGLQKILQRQIHVSTVHMKVDFGISIILRLINAFV